MCVCVYVLKKRKREKWREKKKQENTKLLKAICITRRKIQFEMLEQYRNSRMPTLAFFKLDNSKAIILLRNCQKLKSF